MESEEARWLAIENCVRPVVLTPNAWRRISSHGREPMMIEADIGFTRRHIVPTPTMGSLVRSTPARM
jgi:hypothetical protein